MFRASAHLSQVLVGAGVTTAVHSHGPAPSAPVVTGDRSFAHGRIISDRPVNRPCSRLIRPQRLHPRTAAWRACPRKSHAVGCSWWYTRIWTARGTAGRLRRLEGSARITLLASTSRTRGHASTRPHSVPLANTPFGQWVQTHCP